MLKIIVVSDSESKRLAISQAVELRYSFGGVRVFSFRYGEKLPVLDAFQDVFESISQEITSGDLVHDRFIGILDFSRESGCNEAYDIRAFRSVPGMLILAFPEIQWIPFYKDCVLWSDGADADCFMTLDRAVKLCNGGYSPLFDGDGLRSVLLERVHTGKYDPDHLQYSRTDAAFAIDEESNFASMNAYMAYRFGYRAFPVSSLAAMEVLLKEPSKIPCAKGMHRFRDTRVVVFEDICLEFPDAPPADSKIAFGDNRANAFPILKTADLCVFTTAAADDEKVADCDDGSKRTLSEYFRWNRRRNAISSQRHWYWKTWKERKYRQCFNVLGGFWPGYWGINLLEAGIISSLLIFTLFRCPACFLPVLIFFFLVRGLWYKPIRRFIRRRLCFIPKFSSLLHFRERWVFMPKFYENHCPISFDRNRKYWDVSHKPLAGIFGLRNKCQLPNGRNYGWLFRSKDIKEEYKTARISGKSRSAGDGHAVPGVALKLATLLLHRAERMKSSIIDAEGAVHAAVLANVAFELLNYKTPSLSIEALKRKHYFEVQAECEFVGINARLDMKDRYIDIHNAMGRICRSGDNGEVREFVFLSGMAGLIEELTQLLRDKGKLEEAAYFTGHSRRLYRKLMPPFSRSLLAYPEWVLRDKWNFMLSFGVLCIGILAYCLWQQMLANGASPWDNCWHLVYRVVIARDDLPSELSKNPNQYFIFLLARQIAALHLGFVAAYFLMFMNRK